MPLLIHSRLRNSGRAAITSITQQEPKPFSTQARVTEGPRPYCTQKWAYNTTKSLSGPSFETGLFLKIGVFNLTGTVNGIYSSKTKQNHLSGQIGLGLNIRY
jgi:hypothetical protein